VASMNYRNLLLFMFSISFFFYLIVPAGIYFFFFNLHFVAFSVDFLF